MAEETVNEEEYLAYVKKCTEYYRTSYNNRVARAAKLVSREEQIAKELAYKEKFETENGYKLNSEEAHWNLFDQEEKE